MFYVLHCALKVYYLHYLGDSNASFLVMPQKDWLLLEVHHEQRAQEYSSDLSEG